MSLLPPETARALGEPYLHTHLLDPVVKKALDELHVFQKFKVRT